MWNYIFFEVHANWLQTSSKDHRSETIWFDKIYAFQNDCLTLFFEKAIMSEKVSDVFYHRIIGEFELEKILKIIKSKNLAFRVRDGKWQTCILLPAYSMRI